MLASSTERKRNYISPLGTEDYRNINVPGQDSWLKQKNTSSGASYTFLQQSATGAQKFSSIIQHSTVYMYASFFSLLSNLRRTALRLMLKLNVVSPLTGRTKRKGGLCPHPKT